MRVLLLSGLGPSVKYEQLFEGSFLELARDSSDHNIELLQQPAREALYYNGPNGIARLLRPRRAVIPDLTAATLLSAIDRDRFEVETFSLDKIWIPTSGPSGRSFDVVALSTTFICNFAQMKRAIHWIDDRYRDSYLIVGGQYSNLKYASLMAEIPQIDCIVRGDGEVALPAVLEAVDGRRDWSTIPNLVLRDGATGKVVTTTMKSIDIDAEPSPAFSGSYATVPYESMRGCPFNCGFCSFPAASPEWRYKSADKIVADFARYSRENGARHIRAMDSTFTVPPTRFRDFLARMQDSPVTWECYTRANGLKDADMVTRMEDVGCSALSIGFESMNDASLKRMNKAVPAIANRRATELLAHRDIATRVSFMVGYPGETEDEYEETRQFIVREFPLRFMISVFSLADETMPVWQDAEKHGLDVSETHDADAPYWRHRGMDSIRALKLLENTVRDARWHNESGVMLLWQAQFEMPLVPHLPRAANQRIEKLVERLAMAPRDFRNDPAYAERKRRQALEGLAQYRVFSCADAEVPTQHEIRFPELKSAATGAHLA